jgi:5,10-methenyltetrahydrofolate synthetase
MGMGVDNIAMTSASMPDAAGNPDAGLAPDLRQWRAERRRELLAARCAVPTPLRHQRDQTISHCIQSRFPALKDMVVGGYWPFRGEYDPRFLLHGLRLAGARTALPVVARKNEPLQFRQWWPGAPMVTAALGLPMPDGTELLTPQALLIPPVGFDERGYRLGYGGGYFDLTLAAMHPQPLKIGVAFELSRMPTIRPQWHDIAMDFIVTEKGLYRVGDGGLAPVDDAWQCP